MFVNRVLSGIFGPKRDEVCGEWRKLNIEKLNDFYITIYIFRLMKSRKIYWDGHEERTEKGKMAYILLVGKPKGNEH